MNIFPIEINSVKDLYGIILKIKADPASLPYFKAKGKVHYIYIKDLDTRGANALKQELLSRGGDIIVSSHSIDCSKETTDALIMATDKQLTSLLAKLKYLPYWGLDSIKGELEDRLKKMVRGKWIIPFGGNRPDLVLDQNTRIMGIINLTGNSFYDQSRTSGEDLLQRVDQMIGEGASVIDVGAESTRPGADPVPADEEISRILPAIKLLRSNFPDLFISVDTYKAETAEQALLAGADIINDIYGLKYDEHPASIVAAQGGVLIIGHIRGTPATMASHTGYKDTLAEILEDLESSIQKALDCGVGEGRIILDPGIGFAKNCRDNLLILKNLDSFKSFGYPLLIGHSRKGFIGKTTAAESTGDRIEGTIAVSTHCAMKGISMIRVHDVIQNMRAVKMGRALTEARP